MDQPDPLGNPGPKNFTDPAFQRSMTDAQLKVAIENGNRGMPAFGAVLTPKQISLMIEAYIRKLDSSIKPSPLPAHPRHPEEETMSNVLIALPALDFDPTEAAVSWKVLRGLRLPPVVAFATPEGAKSAADDLMISGEGLDPWGFVPGLRKVALLGAFDPPGKAQRRWPRRLRGALERDDAFLHPLRYDAVRAEDWDGLLLPGGHRARGMRPYLESAALQALIVRAFELDKPVAAVCHGVLLVAQLDLVPKDGTLGVARKRRTTSSRGRRSTSRTGSRVSLASGTVATTAPTRRRLGQPCGYMGVQQEVTRALARPEDYEDVPKDAPDHGMKTDGRHRDTMTDERPAFVVRDGRYLSARWPGDVHTFAKTFATMLTTG